jgi:hypothetical protein
MMLSFFFYGRPVRVTFTKIEAEWPIRVGPEKYYVDLIGRFEEPAWLAKAFNGVLVLEVCDKHPIDEKKRDDLRAVDLGTVEISLPPSLHVRNDEELTAQELGVKVVEIRRFLADIKSENCSTKHYPGWRERVAPPPPTWLPQHTKPPIPEVELTQRPQQSPVAPNPLPKAAAVPPLVKAIEASTAAPLVAAKPIPSKGSVDVQKPSGALGRFLFWLKERIGL